MMMMIANGQECQHIHFVILYSRWSGICFPLLLATCWPYSKLVEMHGS